MMNRKGGAVPCDCEGESVYKLEPELMSSKVPVPCSDRFVSITQGHAAESFPSCTVSNAGKTRAEVGVIKMTLDKVSVGTRAPFQVGVNTAWLSSAAQQLSPTPPQH